MASNPHKERLALDKNRNATRLNYGKRNSLQCSMNHNIFIPEMSHSPDLCVFHVITGLIFSIYWRTCFPERVLSMSTGIPRSALINPHLINEFYFKHSICEMIEIF